MDQRPAVPASSAELPLFLARELHYNRAIDIRTEYATRVRFAGRETQLAVTMVLVLSLIFYFWFAPELVAVPSWLNAAFIAVYGVVSTAMCLFFGRWLRRESREAAEAYERDLAAEIKRYQNVINSL